MGSVNMKLEEFIGLPLETLKKHTQMLKWEGVCMIFLGVIALIMPFAFAKAIEFVFGAYSMVSYVSLSE